MVAMDRKIRAAGRGDASHGAPEAAGSIKSLCDAPAIVQDIRSDLHEMKKLTEATILIEEDRIALAERYNALEERLASAKVAASDAGALSVIPEDERAAVQKMIKLIYDCSPNRLAAKSLVDRILARLGEG